MLQEKLFSIKEVSEQLGVHSRTARKWVETFESYVKPKLNTKGHYVVSDAGLEKLLDIKERMQAPNATMKKVQKELAAEIKNNSETKVTKVAKVEKAPPTIKVNEDDLNQKFQNLTQSIEKISINLIDRMDRVEDHIYNLFDFIEDMEDKLISLSKDTGPSEDIENMFNEIRSKQDQLRVELRSVNFTHKLTSSHESLLPKRAKKSRFLGLF